MTNRKPGSREPPTPSRKTSPAYSEIIDIELDWLEPSDAINSTNESRFSTLSLWGEPAKTTPRQYHFYPELPAGPLYFHDPETYVAVKMSARDAFNMLRYTDLEKHANALIALVKDHAKPRTNPWKRIGDLSAPITMRGLPGTSSVTKYKPRDESYNLWYRRSFRNSAEKHVPAFLRSVSFAYQDPRAKNDELPRGSGNIYGLSPDTGSPVAPPKRELFSFGINWMEKGDPFSPELIREFSSRVKVFHYPENTRERGYIRYYSDKAAVFVTVSYFYPTSSNRFAEAESIVRNFISQVESNALPLDEIPTTNKIK